jgi:hypothetical protein
VVAEIDAAEHIRGLLRRGDMRATWLLASSVAQLKAARSHCAHGQVERAMSLYGHMARAFEADEGMRTRDLAAKEDDGPGRQ